MINYVYLLMKIFYSRSMKKYAVLYNDGYDYYPTTIFFGFIF